MKRNFLYHFLAVSQYSGQRPDGKQTLGRARCRCICEAENDENCCFFTVKYIFSRNVAVGTKYRRIILSWMLEKWIVKM